MGELNALEEAVIGTLIEDIQGVIILGKDGYSGLFEELLHIGVAEIDALGPVFFDIGRLKHFNLFAGSGEDANDSGQCGKNKYLFHNGHLISKEPYRNGHNP